MRPELRQLLVQHFLDEDGFTLFEAREAADLLEGTILRSKFQQTSSLEEAKCLLGFSYGGRYDENRNITRPGPQNKQIEDVMYDHYEKCRKVPRGGDPIAIPVFVQWEVALSGKLRTVVPKQSLHVLVPPVDVMTAKHAHFTTKQILVTVKEMLLQKGMNPAITPIGLFAHRYHLPRVFDLAQEEGFGRIATPSLDDLPRDQDPDCAYPWLRDFQGFVLANSISRLARIRDKLYCDKFSQK